jgi:gluconolactonase
MSSLKPVTVVPQVNFPEGPAWCSDGTLVFTSVPEGALYRVDVRSGELTKFATLGGGALAAAPTTDGGFVVTQNGGYDWSELGMTFPGAPPYAPVASGLQHVGPDGSARYLYNKGFQAPNDLTASPEGVLYFTDPPHYPGPPEPVGRVHAAQDDGRIHLVADGFHFCNGIAWEPGHSLVVVEQEGDVQGLVRLKLDGSREWIVKEFLGDGMALDADGRIYACAGREHAVCVFERDGTEVDRLQIPGPGAVTNCCFGGTDGRTLFVTEVEPKGSVIAFEGLPTRGLQVYPWPVPALTGGSAE